MAGLKATSGTVSLCLTRNLSRSSFRSEGRFASSRIRLYTSQEYAKVSRFMNSIGRSHSRYRVEGRPIDLLAEVWDDGGGAGSVRVLASEALSATLLGSKP